MTDTELHALSVLLEADVTNVRETNLNRTRRGEAPAYCEDFILYLDSHRCLRAELIARAVLKETA